MHSFPEYREGGPTVTPPDGPDLTAQEVGQVTDVAARQKEGRPGGGVCCDRMQQGGARHRVGGDEG
ncbi:MAG: hypothetical protein AVDCRST_MAG70-2418 [uncultured Thermomicrobiales bacterium]|uniref:Uncharacterized protein n=1 Tax=uncultured Thermomicrobiales bacterium TaxID=1645740 RepID=A0A6J4V8J0_9BACT|nr:MAG: hypothetical protein AVDCRST_MAG70-2418 [uncultured Thermomicrobiales bacterium]